MEKSVPRVTLRLAHEARPSDAKLRPEGQIFLDQYLTLMIYSFSCTSMSADT